MAGKRAILYGGTEISGQSACVGWEICVGEREKDVRPSQAKPYPQILADTAA